MVVRRNAIVEKSKSFALMIIGLCRLLAEERREFVLSKQLLRSGTSVGANVREAQRGQSPKDFISKMQIAQKEADESAYWLELLHESEYLNNAEFQAAYDCAQELLKVLASIIVTAKSHTGANSPSTIHYS